jgi:predicted nucleic acid-binding protein
MFQTADLSMKLRERRLGAADRAKVLAAFARLAEESLEVWPVTRGDLRTAARFADRHASGLRAGDALHLAISAERGAPICTLDRAMIAAARTLGVSAGPPS